MRTTAGIEAGAALRAVVAALQVLRDSQCGATGAAEHRELVMRIGRPDDCVMHRERVVARSAGVVRVAALQPDGDDVEWAVVMTATGCSIHVDATDAHVALCNPGIHS